MLFGVKKILFFFCIYYETLAFETLCKSFSWIISMDYYYYYYWEIYVRIIYINVDDDEFD